MKTIKVRYDKNGYYAPTGFGKRDYDQILLDPKITSNAENLFLSSILVEMNEFSEHEVVTKYLEQLSDYSKKVCDNTNTNIIDDIYLQMKPHCFMLLSVYTEGYKIKAQFLKSLQEHVIDLQNKSQQTDPVLDQKTIIPKQKEKSTLEEKPVINNIEVKNDVIPNIESITIEQEADIRHIQTLINEKRTNIKELQVKIKSLKDSADSIDIDDIIYKIDSDTETLQFNKTQIEIQLENIISKLSFVVGDEKKALYKENKELTEKLNEINELIAAQDHQKSVAKRKHLFDSNNSEINRLETVINGLENDIKVYEKQIQDINSTVIHITKSISKSPIENKKILQSYQKKVTIDSQYIKSPYNFEITNVSFLNKSISNYKSFYAVYFNILTRGKQIRIPIQLNAYDNSDKETIYQLELLLLMLIRNGHLNDKQWVFNIENSYHKVFNQAINNVLIWVENLTTLTKRVFEKPTIKISKNEGITILFDDYSFDDNTFCINKTVALSKSIPVWIEPRINYAINTKNVKHQEILNQIVLNLFGFSSYREGQLEIIANFLKNTNTLGILTTGGGKSLTYYLSVLLQPKISLIYSANKLFDKRSNRQSK